jgi:predicted transcriptional regulator
MNKDIAKCLTPKQKIGRIYKLTEKGEKLLKKLDLIK